jgi:hypothetical protein
VIRPRTSCVSEALAAAALAFAGGAFAVPQSASPTPPAATETDEAKRLFSEGSEAYSKGEFQVAAAEFATAYELTHAPELLYNLGRCYEHLGDAERAAAEYQMYLRMSPDAEDRVEIEAKIAALQETTRAETAPSTDRKVDAAPTLGAKDGGEKEKGGSRAIRLAVESGVDVPLLAEWTRLSIPVDAMLLFALNGWLHAGFGLTIVGFIGDKPLTQSGYPTGEFALHGDLAMLKTIKGRFAFTARISVAPTWIFRSHHDNVFWLLARGGVGLHIDIWKSFGVIVEATGGVGPVFNRDRSAMDSWSKVSLAVDVGGRAGITYAF